MPTGTASIKVGNVARLGSRVILYGDDFDEAKNHCNELSEKHGLQNIPPYDDPYVIAGQGTIALELLRQTDVTNLRAVFVSIGGGGLISGIASYIKRIAPHVKVIGVESEDACAMKQSLNKGDRIELDKVGLFAEGSDNILTFIITNAIL
jgi:threonine dehydratase